MPFSLVVGPLLLAQLANVPAFERSYLEARAVTSLGRFLEEVLGNCEDQADATFDRAGCRARARSRRAAYAGQRLRIELSDLEGRLSSPTWHPQRNAYRVLWTPIVGAGGRGLSVGAPRRIDAAGNPVVRRIPLWIERPARTPEFIFRRNLERGMVALDLIVELDRPWRFHRRRGRTAQGISVRLYGWRIRSGRSTLGADLDTDDR